MRFFIYGLMILSFAILLPSCTNSREQTGAKTNALNAPMGAVTIPIFVGYNITKHVDDIRESVVDLVTSLRDVGPQFGYADWTKENKILDTTTPTLEAIQSRLRFKEDLELRAAWEGYIASGTYQVAVHDSLKNLGEVLHDLASGMASSETTKGNMSIGAAVLVLHGVLDVRRSVEKLVVAIGDAGEKYFVYNWADGKSHLATYQQSLSAMERNIPGSNSRLWFGSKSYKSMLSKALNDLGDITSGLSQSIAGSNNSVAH